MRTTKRWMPVVLAALIGAGAHAQEVEDVQVRTLLIQDGKVFIDGRPVPVSESAGVSVRELQDGYFHVTWMGESAPLFPISGRWFRVERDQLVPHPEVIEPLVGAGEHMGVMAPRVRVAPVREDSRRAVEVYLRDLQRENRTLFRRLSDEERMEFETQQLATRIKATQSEHARQELETELRETLDQILEVKHQNRLAEIHELEQRLQELKTNLEQREKLRQELIERRVKELIDRQE